MRATSRPPILSALWNQSCVVASIRQAYDTSEGIVKQSRSITGYFLFPCFPLYRRAIPSVAPLTVLLLWHPNPQPNPRPPRGEEGGSAPATPAGKGCHPAWTAEERRWGDRWRQAGELQRENNRTAGDGRCGPSHLCLLYIRASFTKRA